MTDMPRQNQVIVRSLPNYCTQKDLEECFATVGKVLYTHLLFKGKAKRYGFVAFSTPEEAMEAVKKFNGYEMIIQAMKASKTKIKVLQRVSFFVQAIISMPICVSIWALVMKFHKI